VFVPRLGRKAVISRVRRERREVMVKLGKLSVAVSFDELASDAGHAPGS